MRSSILVCLVCLSALRVSAQAAPSAPAATPVAPTVAPAPAPPASSKPDTLAPTAPSDASSIGTSGGIEPAATLVLPPSAAATGACFPGCRTGYVCSPAAQCVSACNPVCEAGERCTAQGECERAPLPYSPLYMRERPRFPPYTRYPRLQRAHEMTFRRERGYYGLMLRVATGIGVGGASQKGLGDNTYSGAAGTFSIDVGTTPSPNLVLGLRLSYLAMPSPTVKYADGSRSDANTWLSSSLIGGAITYYFLPENAYLTFAAGWSWVTVREGLGAASHSTDPGIGLNIDAGKEWWVDEYWGLGVALRLWYSRISDDGSHNTNGGEYEVGGMAVMFSGTFGSTTREVPRNAAWQ